MHEHVDKHRRDTESHPGFRGLRMRVDGERQTVKLKLGIREPLQRAVGRSALENAFTDASINSICVALACAHGQLSLSRPEQQSTGDQ